MDNIDPHMGVAEIGMAQAKQNQKHERAPFHELEVGRRGRKKLAGDDVKTPHENQDGDEQPGGAQADDGDNPFGGVENIVERHGLFGVIF